MISKKYYFLFILFISFINSSCEHQRVSEQTSKVYKMGDDKRWSSIDFDDKDWKEEIEVNSDKVFWSRTKINITKGSKEFQIYGVDFVNTFGEYEVYWDGVLIGRNGNPGKEKQMGPTGEMWRSYRIPDGLSKGGEHLLAVRRSLYYYPENTRFNAFIEDYDHLLEFPLLYTAFMNIFAGGFLIAAIYFFFLFLGNKKQKPILIFSVSCFLFFALIIMEFIRTYISIHYSQHNIRMEIISYLTFFIAILVPLYFSLQFRYPKQKYIFTTYIVFLIYMFYRKHDWYDYTSIMMAMTTWFFLMGIVSWAVYKKQKGAIIILATLIACFVIFKLTYFDTSLFTGFSVILLGMFYILSVKAKKQRIAYEKSLVQSTRLRLELLKKNIQPHFIMNSLTSLIDWVEESPEKGVLFIEALAREFDLLNQIEDKTLISIHKEIELCIIHLEIMKYRKEINYIWEQEGIVDGEELPPATIHTLLENGITHCAALKSNEMKFKLIFEENKDSKSYTFLTFGIVRKTKKQTRDGTGLKYVKARLNESYGDRWSFSSQSTPEGWKNIIKIENK
ncbi:MAG: histidine kinase [Flavobacteriaceae bacterium]|nr:histidine kinase [Flavobacteriaceae bacterium]